MIADELFGKNFANVLKFMLIAGESFRPDFADLRRNFFVYAEDDQDYDQVTKYAHHKSQRSTVKTANPGGGEPRRHFKIPQPET